MVTVYLLILENFMSIMIVIKLFFFYIDVVRPVFVKITFQWLVVYWGKGFYFFMFSFLEKQGKFFSNEKNR